MPHNLIDDFGLTPLQLDVKYEKKGAHPTVHIADWRRAVRDYQTVSGYWEFVAQKIAEYEDELANDNPYTQWERDIEL